MTVKYHINPTTGNPGICRATKFCPFGSEADHFGSKEEARAAYESMLASRVAKPKSKKSLKAQEQELVAARRAISDQISQAWQRVPGSLGIGWSYNLAIGRDEYAALEQQLWDSEEPLREIRAKLRKADPEPFVSHFPAGLGLAEARVAMAEKEFLSPENIRRGNPRDDHYFDFNKTVAEDINSTLSRYHAGERLAHEQSSYLVLPEDKLLYVLSDEYNGIMSQGAMYAALVFPEKDLAPVLERLGVENVSVSPLNNGREWGLVYSVMDPEGRIRSFSVYEHRNSDSLIINGETNWDPTERPYGPYGGDEKRGKNGFFAEFHADDKTQLAESLGFFLREAQKGELPDDLELAATAEHRDWVAILSEQMPAFKDFADRHGFKPKERF